MNKKTKEKKEESPFWMDLLKALTGICIFGGIIAAIIWSFYKYILPILSGAVR